MRRVYAVSRGSYSDYSVVCLFEQEADAEAAVAAGIGDGVEEMAFYGSSEAPRRAVTKWVAGARAGGRWESPPRVWPEEWWDHELGSVEPEPFCGRPKVKTTAYSDGGLAITVEAADRETALKVCSDRYAQARAEGLGL